MNHAEKVVVILNVPGTKVFFTVKNIAIAFT